MMLVLVAVVCGPARARPQGDQRKLETAITDSVGQEPYEWHQQLEPRGRRARDPRSPARDGGPRAAAPGRHGSAERSPRLVAARADRHARSRGAARSAGG